MALSLALFVLIPFVSFAQTHSYGAAEIEEGGRAYRISCIGCHGGDGNSVGGVDLARGQFKRIKNDEDFAQIIMNGIPNTGMPPSPLSMSRAYMIVAYVKNMATGVVRTSIAAAQGEASRGRELFFGEAACHTCHRIGTEGGRSGPNLSEAGLLLRAIEIETAMLNPDAASPLSGAPWLLILQDGSRIEGFLLNHDRDSLQLLSRQGRLHSIEKTSLRSMERTASWMPSYRDKLKPQQLADLISFLLTQKGLP